MAKQKFCDVVLVVGIAMFIVALPTIYGWYLDGRDWVRGASPHSGPA